MGNVMRCYWLPAALSSELPERDGTALRVRLLGENLVARRDPGDSRRVSVGAYPTCEGGGVVWTYMGPAGTMPAPPDYEWVRTPSTHRFVSKTFEHCNWLQALEGGLDTAHSSFLHNERLGDPTRCCAAATVIRASRSRRTTTVTATPRAATSAPTAITCASISTSCRSADAREHHRAERWLHRSTRNSPGTCGFRWTTRRRSLRWP